MFYSCAIYWAQVVVWQCVCLRQWGDFQFFGICWGPFDWWPSICAHTTAPWRCTLWCCVLFMSNLLELKFFFCLFLYFYLFVCKPFPGFRGFFRGRSSEGCETSYTHNCLVNLHVLAYGLVVGRPILLWTIFSLLEISLGRGPSHTQTALDAHFGVWGGPLFVWAARIVIRVPRKFTGIKLLIWDWYEPYPFHNLVFQTLASCSLALKCKNFRV